MPSNPSRKQRPWLTGQNVASHDRKERNKFYQTTQWRKLRNMFIKENPLCVECEDIARVVDHITPISDGGDALSWQNLQSMCHKCHNSKSGREAHTHRAL